MVRNEKTYTVVMTALMMGLIMLSTFTFKIPTPLTQGYVHLGDAMIFLAVLVLGKKNGALAAGVGSALADLLGGYVAYSVWTLVIKGLMGYIMGAFIELMIKKGMDKTKIFGVPVTELIGMLLAGLVMAIGYAIAAAVMYGNVYSAIMGIPANIGQFGVGLIIAGALAASLYKTPAKKLFAYRLDHVK